MTKVFSFENQYRGAQPRQPIAWAREEVRACGMEGMAQARRAREGTKDLAIEALFELSLDLGLVLAIHAALFEAYLSDKSRPFRFLILDTPKQEELHTADLAQYLKELEKMCEANDAQLDYSSTEYDHPTGPKDKRGLPGYRGPNKPMYLDKREELLADDTLTRR